MRVVREAQVTSAGGDGDEVSEEGTERQRRTGTAVVVRTGIGVEWSSDGGTGGCERHRRVVAEVGLCEAVLSGAVARDRGGDSTRHCTHCTHCSHCSHTALLTHCPPTAPTTCSIVLHHCTAELCCSAVLRAVRWAVLYTALCCAVQCSAGLWC